MAPCRTRPCNGWCNRIRRIIGASRELVAVVHLNWTTHCNCILHVTSAASDHLERGVPLSGAANYAYSHSVQWDAKRAGLVFSPVPLTFRLTFVFTLALLMRNTDGDRRVNHSTGRDQLITMVPHTWNVCLFYWVFAPLFCLAFCFHCTALHRIALQLKFTN